MNTGVASRFTRRVQLGFFFEILEICVSEMAFLAFWQRFWAKSKHLLIGFVAAHFSQNSKSAAPQKLPPGATAPLAPPPCYASVY